MLNRYLLDVVQIRGKYEVLHLLHEVANVAFITKSWKMVQMWQDLTFPGVP